MNRRSSRSKRILILLMAACLFMAFTTHSVAMSMHSDADDCQIKMPCLACVVSLPANNVELIPVLLPVTYIPEIINTSPVIVPDPLYHPPK